MPYPERSIVVHQEAGDQSVDQPGVFPELNTVKRTPSKRTNP